MARRGRPPYPDILTPREWEVLALLRQRLSNEEIARRLEITERTAKYHVSEILGKLGVGSREEAAAWRPEPARPWWAVAVAPLRWASGGGATRIVSGAIAAAVVGATLAGLGLLVFLLISGDGDGGTATGAGPVERIAFAAGGRIFTIAPDGTDPRQVIAGDRESQWNAAPALSPDGRRLLFTRDYDIWAANADGSGARLLADVGELLPAPGASNSSVGAQSMAWAPDGEHIAYVLGRIGGSGIQDVWLMRADGSEQRRIYLSGLSWVQPFWLDSERIAVYENGELRIFRTDGEEQEPIAVQAEQPSSLSAVPVSADEWLVGPIASEGPITFGAIDDARKTVATGVAPVLSPDGLRFAYWQDDSLHVAAVDGNEDRTIANLGDRPGRDRFFGEQPACFPDNGPACSYRLPVISWSSGSAETVRLKTYRDDTLGIEFEHPAAWSVGAAPMPYASCARCVVIGPPDASPPYGIYLFSPRITLSGLDMCAVSSWYTIRTLPDGPERSFSIAGYDACERRQHRQPPLGLTNETGETRVFREIAAFVQTPGNGLFISAFYREDDAQGAAAAVEAYELLFETLRVLPAAGPTAPGSVR